MYLAQTSIAEIFLVCTYIVKMKQYYYIIDYLDYAPGIGNGIT